MKDKNKLIRTALQTNIPDWNKEELWQHIEPKLPKRKSKRRVMIWWWVSCITAVGFLVLFGGYYVKMTKRVTDHKLQKNIKANPVNPNAFVFDEKKTETVTTPEIQAQYDNMSKQYLPTENQKTVFYPKKNSSNTIITDHNSATSTFTQSNSIAGGNLANDDKKIKTLDSFINANESAPDFVKVERSVENLLLLQRTTQSLPYDYPELFHKPMLHADTEKINKEAGIWQISLEGGIADLSKSGKALNASAQNWATFRNKHISPKENLFAGIRFNRVYQNQLRIGFGLEYHRLQEVLTASDIKVTIREVPSDSAFYYSSVSGTEYFSGKIRKIHTTGFSIYSPNALTRWSIPIEIGYTIHTGRFSLTPSAGLLYTFYQHYTGILTDPDGNFIYKNKEATKAIYRSSGPLSWSAALDVKLFGFGMVNVHLGAFYIRDIQSSMRKEIQLDEKFIQKGIRLRLVKTI